MVDTAYLRFEGEKCPKCGTFGEEKKDHFECPACSTEFNKFIILREGKDVSFGNN